MLRYFCFLAVILGVKSASAPFIEPCKPFDSRCLIAAAQAAVPIFAPGIPELSVPSLDPMELKLVKTDEAGLQLTLQDTTVTGLRGCIVEGIKLDVERGKLGVVIRCNVVLQGAYKLGGKLLLFPIQGQGPYTIKIRDIVIKARLDLSTETGADGQAHWRFGKWRHSFQVKTGTTFDFENLFNGNKRLADPVVAFVNSSWREVMQEVAPPIVSAIVQRVVAAVGGFFSAVPASELYLA